MRPTLQFLNMLNSLWQPLFWQPVGIYMQGRLVVPFFSAGIGFDLVIANRASIVASAGPLILPLHAAINVEVREARKIFLFVALLGSRIVRFQATEIGHEEPRRRGLGARLSGSALLSII
jgi:hypothetical protein